MPNELPKSEKPQILIVDDEPEIRIILTEVVSKLGAIALEASKATDAITQMEKYHVDLLLLDIQMQGESGIDLLKVMHRRSNHHQIGLYIRRHGHRSCPIGGKRHFRQTIYAHTHRP